MKILAVHDSKVNAFSQPFFLRTQAEAMRGWIEVVNEPSTQFNKHPEDFNLFLLGDFDEDTGLITPLSAPQAIASAISVIKPKE